MLIVTVIVIAWVITIQFQTNKIKIRVQYCSKYNILTAYNVRNYNLINAET